jgi:hypothetical protein
MTISALAQQIERLDPGASARDVACVCWLLANSERRISPLRDKRTLSRKWERLRLRLSSLADQGSAVAEEIEKIGDPKRSDLVTVARFMTVQNQFLTMFGGLTRA